jgi:hypothetical protein
MSDQYVLSRRKAIALFGTSAAGAAAEAAQSNPATAHAGTGELENDDSGPQYIFGYGSLVQRQSRVGTWSKAEFASAVIVRGVSRGWFDQTGGTSWNPTYLGASLSEEAVCNGVIFPVTAVEFAAYGEREVGYQLSKIDPSPDHNARWKSGSARSRHLVLWQHREEVPVIRTSRRPILCGRVSR